MSNEHTVNSLIKALTEMKKQGLANAVVKIESCDGCVGNVKGDLTTGKSSTVGKYVLIHQ